MYLEILSKQPVGSDVDRAMGYSNKNNTLVKIFGTTDNQGPSQKFLSLAMQ